MKLAIDTNAYRAFVDGDPIFVDAIQRAELIAFSPVVLGELRAGFLLGTRREENEEVLRRVLSIKRVEMHPITAVTSLKYASVWADLRKKGLPIPTNDVWIAAHCLERGCVLLTRDAHFAGVTDLQILP